ncbi:MAG: TIGR00725 family protein [Synergistales bacterium]|nr:TIGR00725 family protein [Synergistales bacterium]
MTDANVRPPVVSVIGSSTPSEELYEAARTLGRLLAEQGITVVCGGRGGVMEGVCRGVAEGGGFSVGLLPHSLEEANPWVSLPIVTGLGEARNLAVATAGQVVAALDGGFGTLSEIAFALRAGKPIVAYKTFQVRDEQGDPVPLTAVESPEEAAEAVVELLRKRAER